MGTRLRSLFCAWLQRKFCPPVGVRIEALSASGRLTRWGTGRDILHRYSKPQGTIMYARVRLTRSGREA
jgi:hypothetical protein